MTAVIRFNVRQLEVVKTMVLGHFPVVLFTFIFNSFILLHYKCVMTLCKPNDVT